MNTLGFDPKPLPGSIVSHAEFHAEANDHCCLVQESDEM